MKTTKQDFEYFKSQCRVWQEILELGSWELYFCHKKLDSEFFAEVASNYKGQKASIFLNTNFKVDVEIDKREQIKKTALHEMLHVFLNRMNCLASDRIWDETEWQREEHYIINHLVRLLRNKRGDK